MLKVLTNVWWTDQCNKVQAAHGVKGKEGQATPRVGEGDYLPLIGYTLTHWGVLTPTSSVQQVMTAQL